MRFLVGLAAALAALWAGTLLAQEAVEPYHAPVYGSHDPARRLLEAGERMRIGADAEPWLPRLVEALRRNRPAHTLEQVLLVEGEGGQYVVSQWSGYLGKVDFHRVVAAADGRRQLRFLRRLEDGYAELLTPTGQALFGEAVPVIVVYLASGGSGADGYEVRLIQMRRGTVDITPDWAGRVADIADIDGDGALEVIAFDRRWPGFFDTRGAAGPHLPVILARREGRFVPACRDHTAFYRRDIARMEEFLSTEPSTYVTELKAEIMLEYAQIGAFAEARRALAGMEAAHAGPEKGMYPAPPEYAAKIFRAALAATQRFPEAQCAVAAAPVRGGHSGAEARTRYLAFPVERGE